MKGSQGAGGARVLGEIDAQPPPLPACCLRLAGSHRVGVRCPSPGWKSRFRSLTPKTTFLAKRDEVRPSNGEGG